MFMLKITRVYARLLAIVAKELGYDALVLTHDYTKMLEQSIKRDIAVLMSHGSYDTVPLLKADGSIIEVEYSGYDEKLRAAEGYGEPLIEVDELTADSYKKLAAALYRILDNGGTLKYNLECGEKPKKKSSITAADVPEFMIKCVLSGLAER